MELSSDQIDALTEVMNIGVGKAASSLSELVGTKVVLKVPRVRVYQIESLSEIEGFHVDSMLAIISQDFGGGIDGRATLVFPENSAKRLASLLGAQSFHEESELDEESKGILLEVGNILLNAVLGTISNMVSETLIYEVPVFTLRLFGETIREVASSAKFSADARVIQVEATFDVDGQCISGSILIFCKFESLEMLLTSLLAA